VKRLVVSAAARDDLRAIARYTERRWGAAQKQSYPARRQDRFLALRRNPAIGPRRDDLGPGYRSALCYTRQPNDAGEWLWRLGALLAADR